jgi:alkanesulfonate monooxygenase SsuD/methylene tetrahydromethanopterin reductase-like flavin-dependent oxidoreductase (luciferase family)
MMEAMQASGSTHRGLGVTAGLDAGLARELAARCEQLGYHSLWSNDEPTARGLGTLAEFAAATATLEIGVGVFPLHRYRPAQIAAEVERLGLDPARLWLGIGSGALARQIDALQRAVAELRMLLPEGTRIVVAAMRPRLCRLGGSIADGVLLNWMLPDQAARARGWVREGAAEQRRTPPVVASYVRVAVGQGARRRLREQESYYRAINERPIASISPRWVSPSGAQHRSGPMSSTHWRRTTRRWTSRSCACSPTRTGRCSAPLRTPLRRDHGGRRLTR